MPRTSQQRSGDFAEQRALRLLQQRGWRLLSRQWRCRWGELDLVASKR
ncbi:YraN family protein [Cyanobium sp. FGCU-52]|nr:YraN family protein [Cyanobium sp. FGCU52]